MPRRQYRLRRPKQEFYDPFYDDYSDFNTNAPAYYHYLGKKNKGFKWWEWVLNRLLRRNIKVTDTYSIDLTKTGDWIKNQDLCPPNNWNDVIDLKADVIISPETETVTFTYLTPSTFTVPNGSIVKNTGVWSPDYINALQGFNNEIGNIQNDINDINQQINDIWNSLEELTNIVNNQGDQITNLTNALQKIIDNLFISGAITNNNINNFIFNQGIGIANGNINFFGGVSDGNFYIRTNKTNNENDVTAGITQTRQLSLDLEEE